LFSGYWLHDRGRSSLLDFAQPRFTPENRTRFLATVVVCARAAQLFQQDDVICPEFPQKEAGFRSRGADFQHPSGYSKPSPAVLDHFPHQRQLIYRASVVESRGDFTRSLYLN
jgi:hypothetical protein